MNEPIKIAVVGDGPIGNLVVAKLLIEHGNNKFKNNDIHITHLTSKRVDEKGYTRRHILFITEELVNELEKSVLACEKCLINIKNEQFLTEDTEDGRKLLFSTRLLEQILLDHIKDNSDTYCNTGAKCTFETIVNTTVNYYHYNYVFFAIGSNAAPIRETYFYSGNKYRNVKIKAPQANPIVAFYSDLGTPNEKLDVTDMLKDMKSKIQLITKDELDSQGINIYELEKFVTIIYTLYDKMQIFIDRYIFRKVEKIETPHFAKVKGTEAYENIIFSNLPEKIKNQIKVSYTMIEKVNISLYGYDDFNSFINKFANGIIILQRFFNLNQDDKVVLTSVRTQLYNSYLEFLISENMRPSIDVSSREWYQKIINNHNSIITLLNNYIKFIYTYLKKIEPVDASCSLDTQKDHAEAELGIQLILPEEYAKDHNCLQYKFLVNIVQQSLDCFGIYNNELAYASKKETTNFFMIGDMANAYPAGISVEIGINFVNYIIPIFYNFYIKNQKTVLKCTDLNILAILDDLLLSDKYKSLLSYETNITSSLRELIQGIRNNYNDYLIKRYNNTGTDNKLCDDNDIFLTYYNIVLLIQFIKNVHLILQEKKIIAISKEFQPSNYKIIDMPIQKVITDIVPLAYNEKLQSN